MYGKAKAKAKVKAKMFIEMKHEMVGFLDENDELHLFCQFSEGELQELYEYLDSEKIPYKRVGT